MSARRGMPSVCQRQRSHQRPRRGRFLRPPGEAVGPTSWTAGPARATHLRCARFGVPPPCQRRPSRDERSPAHRGLPRPVIHPGGPRYDRPVTPPPPRRRGAGRLRGGGGAAPIVRAAVPDRPAARGHAEGHRRRRRAARRERRRDLRQHRRPDRRRGPFEDADHRPLVLRRTRLQSRAPRSWSTFEDSREAVPFEIHEGLDAIASTATPSTTGSSSSRASPKASPAISPIAPQRTCRRRHRCGR